jgi:hypothetical protein
MTVTVKNIANKLIPSSNRSKLAPYFDEIVELKAKGYSYNQIADILFIAYNLKTSSAKLCEYIKRHSKRLSTFSTVFRQNTIQAIQNKPQSINSDIGNLAYKLCNMPKLEQRGANLQDDKLSNMPKPEQTAPNPQDENTRQAILEQRDTNLQDNKLCNMPNLEQREASLKDDKPCNMSTLEPSKQQTAP